jgi:arabinofuranosyltransferase
MDTRQRVAMVMAASALPLPAIVVFVLHSLGHGAVFVDDAYIFYRYASNWAAGHGLVYNIGEYVEGYSSLLWTLMLAVGAGWSFLPETLAPVLGVALGIVCLVLLAYSARFATGHSAVVAVTLPVACSLSTGFTYYSVSGMDTVLFATVVLATTVAALASTNSRKTGLVSVCLVILVVVRAEGFLYALTILAVVGLAARQGLDRVQSGGRQYAIVVGVTCAAILLQFGGRRLVYGEWIPATVSAKAYTTFALQSALGSSSQNLRPFIDALLEGIRYEIFVAPLAIVPALMLALQAVRTRTLPLFPGLLAAVIVVNMGVTIWAAGDWMDYHRHVVPVWPLWLLLLAWGLRQASADFRIRPRLANPVIALGLLCAGAYAIEAPFVPPTLAGWSSLEESGRSLYKRQVGVVLHQFGAPVTVVTNVAGKMPYYAGASTYARDLLGLTDEHNATRGDVWTPTYGRTDYEYSFGRPFDLLVTNSYTDLEQLLAYWNAHPDGRQQFALYPSDQWTDNCFFVVAKPRDALGARVQELCGCQPRRLDERFLEIVRALPQCSGVTEESDEER